MENKLTITIKQATNTIADFISYFFPIFFLRFNTESAFTE